MNKPMPKQAYLYSLQERNRHNRQVVETVFLPLDQDQRSWQPAPGEWSVDQCFEHLIRAFEFWSRNIITALAKPEPPGADGIYRPSWWARRLNEWQFDPSNHLPTLNRFNPQETYHADVFTRFMAQQDRLGAMIDKASGADLQTMCWFVKPLPVRNNLGDYLNFFVSHDELHMHQAQRVLQAQGITGRSGAAAGESLGQQQQDASLRSA